VDPAFAARVKNPAVQFLALNKPPGHAVAQYPKVWRLMRELRPAIVHSRNLAALEMQLPAALARVPVRIHGEHGRDLDDVDGLNKRLQRLRRVYSPLVHRYITVSEDLRSYLCGRVGIARGRVEQIYNGVDTSRFVPGAGGAQALAGSPWNPAEHWVVGTVGRLQAVKNQVLLVRAFARARELSPLIRERARLSVVGDGPARAEVQAVLDASGAGPAVWLAGERSDVPDVMRSLNAFVLPSMAEGVSNTILEAMASGLPVLATAVGGNGELVQAGITGQLTPSNDVEAMAQALAAWAADPERAAAWGSRARAVAESEFSLQAMVARYAATYDAALQRQGWRRP
jgi:sugar transferase (PEP-CTERM/EpsH1 system associated)